MRNQSVLGKLNARCRVARSFGRRMALWTVTNHPGAEWVDLDSVLPYLSPVEMDARNNLLPSTWKSEVYKGFNEAFAELVGE